MGIILYHFVFLHFYIFRFPLELVKVSSSGSCYLCKLNSIMSLSSGRTHNLSTQDSMIKCFASAKSIQNICHPQWNQPDSLSQQNQSQDDCLNFTSKPILFNTLRRPGRTIYNFEIGRSISIEFLSRGTCSSPCKTSIKSNTL
jgi:hypothetical protein